MHPGIADIIFLVCHVVSKDNVIKGSCNFMVGKPFTILPTLVTTVIVVVEIGCSWSIM